MEQEVQDIMDQIIFLEISSADLVGQKCSRLIDKTHVLDNIYNE